MSPRKIACFAALATVLLTSVGWHRVQQSRQQEVSQLRAENEALRFKRSPQQRASSASTTTSASLPASVPPASDRTVNAAPSASATAASRNAPQTSAAVTGRDYRNEGQATPLAALQTLAWACDQGDSAVMTKLMAYDADARKKTEDYFASLPPNERPPIVSLEATAGDVYLADGINHPYPEASVLAMARFETIKPGRLRLHLPDANGDGYEFQQTPDGWKVAITLRIVNNYIEETARLRAQAKR